MALNSGVARTRNHEGPPVGPQPGQSLASGLRHQRAVGVVHLEVRLRLPTAWMDDVRRHGRVRWDEQARLIHVAPDPIDTCIEQCLVLLSPPCARFRICEIGEGTDAWPDDILVIVTLWCLAVEVARLSFGVDRVAGVDLDTRIHDAHRVESHLVQLSEQAFRVREADWIPRENPVAIQRVDIEIQRVAWNVALAKRAGDVPDLVRRLVAEPALAIAQRPDRRKRRVSRKVRVARQHVLRRWAAKDVVDEVSACRPKPGPRRIIVGEIELDARRAVEKEAPGLALGQDERERDGGVEVVLQRRVTARRIDIPEKLLGPRLVQLTRALAAPEVVLTGEVLLVDADRRLC